MSLCHDTFSSYAICVIFEAPLACDWNCIAVNATLIIQMRLALLLECCMMQ